MFGEYLARLERYKNLVANEDDYTTLALAA